MATKTRQPRDTAAQRPRKLLTPRAGAALVGGLAVAWYSLAATATTVLPDRSPDMAMAFGLTGADAMAAQSLRILEAQPSPAEVKRAQGLARRALAREPINVTALRALGLSAVVEGDEAKAEALFEASERLSRRDLAAQLWLIENAVKRGDIAGTLSHYDRALRTSDRSAGLLIPVLAQATDEPLVAAELVRLLARRPPWWSAYYEQLVTTTRSPASLASITRAIRLDTADLGERQLLVSTMVRLMQLGAYGQAFDLYRRANGGGTDGTQRVRNGDFAENGLLPPFDWSLSEEPDLAGALEPRSENSANMALQLITDGSRSGEVARQLLMLAPGSYRISAIAGNVSGPVIARPAFELVCASSPPRPNEKVLLTLALPEAPAAGRRLAGSFEVPAACPAQLLLIRVNGAPPRESDPTWVDSIVIDPA